MLKDRKALLEQEIRKAHEAAANLYLEIVVNNGNVQSEAYQDMKERIMDLQFDLDMVNRLIYKGHE